MNSKGQNIQKADAGAAVTVAAIDIGANSIRAAIAEVASSGTVKVLEQFRRIVRLGQDTFRRGRISGSGIRSVVDVIRDYRQKIDFYDVRKLRAVATSAVREATNSDNLLDRVLIATGVEIDVIGTPEESRLTVSAVRQALGEVLTMSDSRTLIVDVGGGSTLLTVMQDGEVTASLSMPLGSIRLQENLATTEESPILAARLIRQHIHNFIATAQRSSLLKGIRQYVATGGDVRFAAEKIGKPGASSEFSTITRRCLDKFVSHYKNHTAEELANQFSLQFVDAETLNPALMVQQALMHACSSNRMIVSKVSMRDGLLLDLARFVRGQEDPALAKGVIQSATAIAAKYSVDLAHARNVAAYSVRLFDELRAEHGLEPRHRLLLQAAAILHEVGRFVSNRSHHKHSYYLLANSEVFGLTRDEINQVAHIARYHRRSEPKSSHAEYMRLPREQRIVVSKLTALLRVADALDRSHAQQAGQFTTRLEGREMTLLIKGAVDLTAERRSIANKGRLFEDIYGMKIHLEESG